MVNTIDSKSIANRRGGSSPLQGNILSVLYCINFWLLRRISQYKKNKQAKFLALYSYLAARVSTSLKRYSHILKQGKSQFSKSLKSIQFFIFRREISPKELFSILIVTVS